jgi:hypothetical protein
MKNTIIALLLLASAGQSFAQIYVNGKDVDQDSTGYYMEVVPRFFLSSNQYSFLVDYGQRACMNPFNQERCMVTDRDNNVLRFKSVIDGLNFFYKNGWEVWLFTTADEDSNQYLLRRTKINN